MSITKTQILPGHFYHIYNRGINKQTIFKTKSNYHFFLNKMKHFFTDKIDVYTYCLMPNHFHFLIYINTKSEKPYLAYSHLLNSYTQAFNRQEKKKGPIFEGKIKRKIITDEKYNYQLICYIHHNPIHHGFSEYKNYPWSSYKSFLSNQPTLLKRMKVLEWFGDIEQFITIHDQQSDLRKIRDWIID